jgi:hypothetical protein
MSQNFIVSDWFANRASLNIQTFTVEGIEFELMALSDTLIESVELCDTYEDMITLAANYGLSYSRRRVIDDADLAQDIDLLWGLDNLDIDTDPCIRSRVGERVCEISCLADVLDDMLEAEKARDKAEAEAALIKVGDVELAGSTLIDNLNQDSLESDATAYANA